MTEDQISPMVCFPLAAGPAAAKFIITIIFTGRPKKKDIIRHAMLCPVMEDVSSGSVVWCLCLKHDRVV